ncbi:MAG: DUF1320 domain-containing protein [Gammaproteobacteria bacterium]|nr:DUF1320 domain-containing protein [Gammaproteobacteria bacterium]
MAYCTATQVRDVLSGVNTSVMTDEAIENKIAYAESIINAYVAWRYNVPFSTTPALIETICIDITAYYVMRTLFTRDNVNTNEYIYEFLLKHLNTKEKTGTLYDLQNGDISLTLPDGSSPPASTEVFDSNITNYVPTFDVDGVLDWEVSSERLEDIANDRSDS